MNPTWAAFVPIIAKHGVTFAYQLWRNIKDKKEPTEEDWQILIGSADKSADEYLLEAIRKLNPTPGTSPNPNP